MQRVQFRFGARRWRMESGLSTLCDLPAFRHAQAR